MLNSRNAAQVYRLETGLLLSPCAAAGGHVRFISAGQPTYGVRVYAYTASVSGTLQSDRR